LNASSSSLENVSICTRCKDHDFDACIDHASTIAMFNDEIVQLNFQLKTCKNEVQKVKFARDIFTIGRHPSIKDALGFHRGAKNIKSHTTPNFTKEKEEAPISSSSNSFHDKNHAFIYTHAKNVHHDASNDRSVLPTRHDVVFTPRIVIASSSDSYAHGRNRPRRHASLIVPHVPKDRSASNGPSILYRTFDASYVLHCKNGKIVATNVGPKSKKGKTYIWVPKSYVTNMTGPNKSWGPKPKFLVGLCVWGLKLDH
jgi:hypothetical protein